MLVMLLLSALMKLALAITYAVLATTIVSGSHEYETKVLRVLAICYFSLSAIDTFLCLVAQQVTI